jgi:hypothetical protein
MANCLWWQSAVVSTLSRWECAARLAGWQTRLAVTAAVTWQSQTWRQRSQCALSGSPPSPGTPGRNRCEPFSARGLPA